MEIKRSKKKKKKSFPDRIFDIFTIMIMVIVVLVILYPIWNMVVRSFNYTVVHQGACVHTGYWDWMSPFRLWPEKFTLRNYAYVFSGIDISRGMFNSVLRTVIGTILGVIINAGLAFILSRKEFILRSQLSAFWIIASCLECGIIPMYSFISQMHLRGTFWVYIIPGLVNVLYVFVMRTYMNSIPENILDQARIDGASYFQIFIKIVSPMCKPIYAAIALFIAMMHWNSWFDVLLYNRVNREHTTLQYEIHRLLGSVFILSGDSYESFTIRATVTVITMVPIILFGILMQKYYIVSVENIIGNSMKKD